MNRRASVAMLMTVAVLGGCDAATDPGTDPSVFTVGRLERGNTILVYIARGTDTTLVPQSDLSVEPSAAAAPSPTGTGLVLKLSGPATISILGTTDDPRPSTTITVVNPPSFLFDMEISGNRDIFRAAIDGLELERLTTNPAEDIQPTSAKGTLVFTSFRNGNGDLFSRPLAGSGAETQLSTTTVNEVDADLSPDGNRLAYVRDDGSTLRVWIAQANNSGAASLTSSPVSATEGSPSWRFSSDSLAFMSTTTGSATIFVAAGTSGAVPIQTASPGGVDSVFVEPAWSMDGKRIAFTAAGSGGASRIAVRTLADATTTFLTPPTLSCGQPVFVRDDRIVFTVFGPAGSTTLSWVDPAIPGVLHPIPLPVARAQHSATIWP